MTTIEKDEDNIEIAAAAAVAASSKKKWCSYSI
jgi:hypothetical protein